MNKVSFREINQSKLSSTPIIEGCITVCSDSGRVYKDTSTEHKLLSEQILFVDELPIAPLLNKFYFYNNALYLYVNDDWVNLNGASEEQIRNSVNEYLNKNPVAPGATSEQAEQIQDNTNKISELKSDLNEILGEPTPKEEVAEMEQGTFSSSTGEEKESTTRIRTVNDYTHVTEIVFRKSDEYIMNCYIFYFYNGTPTVKNQYVPRGSGSVTYTVDETIPYDYIRVAVGISGNAEITPETFTGSILVKYGEKTNGVLDDMNTRILSNEQKIASLEEAGKGVVGQISHNQIARLGWNVYSRATPPQQTLPSYALAYKNGCRIMLADIRSTSDGHLVCLHDADLGATLGTNYFRKADGTELTDEEKATLISEMTLSELLALDCGLYKGNKWQGMKVLQIEDFLRWCSQFGCVPMIETRGTITDEQILYVGSLCDKYDCYENVIITEDESYWNSRLTKWSTALPNAKYMCVRGGSRNFDNAFSICNSLKDRGYKPIIGFSDVTTLSTNYETVRNSDICVWFSEVDTNNVDSMYDSGYLNMIDFVSSSYVNITEYRLNKLLN